MAVGFGVMCAVVALMGLFILFRNLPVRGCAYKGLWLLFGVLLMGVALLFGFHVLRP